MKRNLIVVVGIYNPSRASAALKQLLAFPPPSFLSLFSTFVPQVVASSVLPISTIVVRGSCDSLWPFHVNSPSSYSNLSSIMDARIFTRGARTPAHIATLTPMTWSAQLATGPQAFRRIDLHVTPLYGARF